MHDQRVRFVVGSIVVHLLALLVLLRGPHHASDVIVQAQAIAPPRPTEQLVETELVFELLAVDAPAGGGGSSGATRRPTLARSRPLTTSASAWDDVAISQEQIGGGDGRGSGGGRGDGLGSGIGFGTGGGIGAPQLVPAPPRAPTPPPSRARPAKLIYPVRDREVDDEGNLFIARITVDTDGDVVGAHMIKTRPGVTGDQASSAIWTFRYLPALDDRGTPIRSTFDQPFQIR
jgi:hypothetical protein